MSGCGNGSFKGQDEASVHKGIVHLTCSLTVVLVENMTDYVSPNTPRNVWAIDIKCVDFAELVETLLYEAFGEKGSVERRLLN
jgi:hypothetical protein